MWKKGQHNKLSWKKRFFVLYDGSEGTPARLDYFDKKEEFDEKAARKEEDKRRRGSIEFDRVEGETDAAVKIHLHATGHRFSVLDGKTRTLHLAALSLDEMHDWMAHLGRAVQSYEVKFKEALRDARNALEEVVKLERDGSKKITITDIEERWGQMLQPENHGVRPPFNQAQKDALDFLAHDDHAVLPGFLHTPAAEKVLEAAAAQEKKAHEEEAGALREAAAQEAARAKAAADHAAAAAAEAATAAEAERVRLEAIIAEARAREKAERETARLEEERAEAQKEAAAANAVLGEFKIVCPLLLNPMTAAELQDKVDRKADCSKVMVDGVNDQKKHVKIAVFTDQAKFEREKRHIKATEDGFFVGKCPPSFCPQWTALTFCPQ
jgi:hypothetical protein